jgi:hypothetical protein
MSEHADAALEAAFAFTAPDREANRQGRLTKVQEARLRSASAGARLGLAVFALATLGSVGAVLLTGLSDSLPQASPGAAVVALAGVLAVAVGTAVSLPYVGALRGRRVAVAEGTAQPGRREDAVRIGVTELRLPSQEQRDAFLPGEPYRVFFLPGPVPLVLSAEALGGPSRRRVAAESLGEEEARAAADPALRLARRARWLVVGIGVFVLQVIALVVAAPALAPREWRPLLGVLFAEAVAVVVVALVALRRR